MSKYKIGCLTYKKLDILTRNAITKINDPEIEIVLLEGFMEDLIDKVRMAMDDGVEVFIGGGANAETVRNSVGIDVVPIKLTALDYIEALIHAKKVGRRIAIVSYKSTFKLDLQLLEEIIQNEIILIEFDKGGEIKQNLIEANVDVVIGASYANEVAYDLGIAGILIYPGEEAILNTILESKSIAKALRKEKEKSLLINSIMEFNPSGIIATDEKGNIITFNPAAEKITGIHSNDAIGRDIRTILPECDLISSLEKNKPQLGIVNKVKNNDVIVDRIPIKIRDTTVGALGILSPTWAIQKAEQKIRLLNKEKGFVAKNNFHDIVGSSKTIKEITNDAMIFAKSDSNLLIYGETGVGKEIFAQSIHNFSKRINGAFVAINCAALPENLLESELFGYDDGAFTGAKKGGKTGLFETAHEGTILLDEIGEITPALQSKLLRVLQEKEVMRIGGDRIIPVNVRVIAATNINLEEKIPKEFRSDLFYRLNVLQLNIPPLRNRGDDILELFMHFYLKRDESNSNNFSISEDISKILKSYSWPGNIRELDNVTERLYLYLTVSKNLSEEGVREQVVRSIGYERIFNDVLNRYGFQVERKNISKDIIQELEFLFPGKKEYIAERLGVSRTTLWRIMK